MGPLSLDLVHTWAQSENRDPTNIIINFLQSYIPIHFEMNRSTFKYIIIIIIIIILLQPFRYLFKLLIIQQNPPF